MCAHTHKTHPIACVRIFGTSCTPPTRFRYLTSFKDELLSTWLISTTPPQPRAAACVISKIYDQTEYRNDLGIGPAGGNGRKDMPVDAAKEPVSIGGHSVYGAYFEGGMGYRNDTTTKVATDNEPESIYMVASGTHYNGGCCFDYGNAEINNRDDGAGTMECVYFGSWNAKRNGGWCGGDGDGTPNAGPWVMADLENGEETKQNWIVWWLTRSPSPSASLCAYAYACVIHLFCSSPRTQRLHPLTYPLIPPSLPLTISPATTSHRYQQGFGRATSHSTSTQTRLP
jgi:hypothetical protein